MIRRYVYGTVFETEAILEKPAQESGQLPFLTVDEGKMTFFYKMEDSDKVYGLGENVRGINKRGWIYQSKCQDFLFLVAGSVYSFLLVQYILLLNQVA